MEIIDENGDLFGVVNVVDALVVLLVLAVGAAGVALVTADDPEPEPEPEPPDLATTHVTLDLGQQPDYVVAAIEEGDSFAPTNTSTITITDTYLAPSDGDARVVLRAELEGERADETIAYDGAPPRLGRDLTIQTDRYQVGGTIRDVGEERDLPTTETRVLLRTTLQTDAVDDLESGQEVTSGGRTLATVESVEAFGTRNPDRKRAFVGLTLETLADGEDPTFGATTVREGERLALTANGVDVRGSIHRVGATALRGEPATRSVTLQLRDVPPQLADSVGPGMAETVRGETVAEITDVERENATVVLTSEDGQIYEREHPVNVDVTLTADLAVRETTTGVTFKGRTIRRGSTVTLDLGSTSIEATVVSAPR